MLSAPQSMSGERGQQEGQGWIGPVSNNAEISTRSGSRLSGGERGSDAVIIQGNFGQATLLTLTHSLATHARSNNVVLIPVGEARGNISFGQTAHPLEMGKPCTIAPWQAFSVEVPARATLRLFTCCVGTDWVDARHTNAQPLAKLSQEILVGIMLRGAAAVQPGTSLAPNAYRSFAAGEASARDVQVTDFRIRRAIRHIHSHPDCPVDTLARLAGIGTQHFFDRFRACTGLTPRGYANVIRLERAIDGVANGERTLGDISCDLGFADQSHFTRFFRSRIGLNPLAYRAAAAAGRQAALHING